MSLKIPWNGVPPNNPETRVVGTYTGQLAEQSEMVRVPAAAEGKNPTVFDFPIRIELALKNADGNDVTVQGTFPLTSHGFNRESKTWKLMITDCWRHKDGSQSKQGSRPGTSLHHYAVTIHPDGRIEAIHSASPYEYTPPAHP